jgi:chorismate--pyruvate lyase
MQLNFPVSEPCQWQPPEHYSLTSSQRNWLLAEGSLTKKLKQHCRQFRVQLIGQRPAPIFDSEFDLFKRHHTRVPFEASVREVLLYCDDKPWVFARSLFPLSALRHKNLNLSGLGDSSLGLSLFDQPDLLRSPFEVAQLPDNHAVARLNHQLFGHSQNLWGRRSLFLTSGQRVLVSEIFLSPLPFYQSRASHSLNPEEKGHE